MTHFQSVDLELRMFIKQFLNRNIISGEWRWASWGQLIQHTRQSETRPPPLLTLLLFTFGTQLYSCDTILFSKVLDICNSHLLILQYVTQRIYECHPYLAFHIIWTQTSPRDEIKCLWMLQRWECMAGVLALRGIQLDSLCWIHQLWTGD